MTLIEIRPQGNGWKVFEASGVEPVFPEKDHAMGLCAEPRVFQLPLSVFGVWIRLRPAAVNVRAVYQMRVAKHVNPFSLCRKSVHTTTR
jgi:hypothetical protein